MCVRTNTTTWAVTLILHNPLLMSRRNQDDHEEDLDDDELFAQLEAELEGDDSTAVERERGMKEMMQ